ncbi:high-potential iron-sulfur protein [Dokdonella sp.]|uniref:high-potential iron-sulfur protein n=1 Tax=Dokdonella sp. TaxID=2291710 RepID=UPI002F3E2074
MSDPAESQGRRRFLKIAVVGAAIAPVAAGLLPRVARAQDSAPHLDPNDPTAKALAYTEDASTAKGNPTYKEGSTCAGCNFYKGHTEMTYGPCDLFPGKVVSAKGWCASWTKKV